MFVSLHALHAIYAGWYFAIAFCFMLVGSAVGSGARKLSPAERTYVVAVAGIMWLIAMALSLFGYLQLSVYLGE